MQQDEIMKQLKVYVSEKVLDGKDIGLDETTPLLEWGIINSLEIVRLLNFIHTQFHVEISPDQLIADHFVNLSSITDLVVETARGLSLP